MGQRQRPLSTNGINVNDLNDIVIKGKGQIHDVARFLAWRTYVSVVPEFGQRILGHQSTPPPKHVGQVENKGVETPILFMKGWAL